MIIVIPYYSECNPPEGYVEITAPNWWYLDGNLDRKFHYDKASMYVSVGNVDNLCSTIKNTYNSKDNGLESREFLFLNSGIYDVKVLGFKGECRAYIWHQIYGEVTDMRGYVVSIDDTEAVKHAEDKFYKRSVVI